MGSSEVSSLGNCSFVVGHHSLQDHDSFFDVLYLELLELLVLEIGISTVLVREVRSVEWCHQLLLTCLECKPYRKQIVGVAVCLDPSEEPFLVDGFAKPIGFNQVLIRDRPVKSER
jgi:hypothetical protein